MTDYSALQRDSSGAFEASIFSSPTGMSSHSGFSRPGNILSLTTEDLTHSVCVSILAHGLFEKQEYTIKIRDDDDQPLWLTHPARNVDIAVIPMTFSEDQLKVINLYPISELTSSDLPVYIGMDVFILGYPFGAGSPAYIGSNFLVERWFWTNLI